MTTGFEQYVEAIDEILKDYEENKDKHFPPGHEDHSVSENFATFLYQLKNDPELFASVFTIVDLCIQVNPPLLAIFMRNYADFKRSQRG